MMPRVPYGMNAFPFYGIEPSALAYVPFEILNGSKSVGIHIQRRFKRLVDDQCTLRPLY